MKINLRPLFLISICMLAGCKSTPDKTPVDAPVNPELTEQTTEKQPGDTDESDRGFDPCKLNPGLTICNEK